MVFLWVYFQILPRYIPTKTKLELDFHTLIWCTVTYKQFQLLWIEWHPYQQHVPSIKSTSTFKGSQLNAFCQRPYCIYCYPGFKLGYLKNLKLFSIKSKRIIWVFNFAKKRWCVFALFKSIFLRHQSMSNTRWFCSKTHKIGKGNLYLTKIDWVETKSAVQKIITIIWVTCVQKNSQIHTLTKQLLVIYFKTTLLLPYKIHGSSMRGILFFNLASCELLTWFFANKYKSLWTPDTCCV